jgi:antitoxin component of MazEF toxin-antitoxin module
MKQKIIKAGNSLAVTIPSKFAKDVGVKLGDSVGVTTRPDKGQLILNFSGIRQLTLTSSLTKS